MDKTLQVIEKLVNSAPALVSFETADAARALDLFKSLSLTHESPFYQWSLEDGLHRLGASHIIIPRTRQPEHLLEYINSLQHPGIFLLPSFAEVLNSKVLLSQFKKTLAVSSKDKILVLIDETISLPEELSPFTQRVRLGGQKHNRKVG
jgi:hypothetical protein